MTRVFLNNPLSLLKEIKEKSNIKSIKKISSRLNLNYSNLKQYFRGERSFPQYYFDLLIKEFSLERGIWYKRIKLKDDNWGKKKGAKVLLSKLSKKEINKMAERAWKKREGIIKKISKNKDFYEFYGILLGDGCICKFKQKRKNSNLYIINISGHKILDYKYHKNYIRPLIKKVFGKNCYIYRYKKNNSMYLRFRNKRIALELNKEGLPFGKKGQKIKLTSKMQSLNWEKKKSIIRGIFDTDGCILAKRHEKFRYPYIIISLSSIKLLKQIHKTLRDKSYPFDFRREKERASEIRMRGNKNIVRWMSDIGSNNPKHIIKYRYWKNKGILPKNINLGP